MADYPVEVRSIVGHASYNAGGVRTLEIDPNFAHLNLQGVQFSDVNNDEAMWWTFASTADFPAEAAIGDYGFSPDTNQVWRKT